MPLNFSTPAPRRVKRAPIVNVPRDLRPLNVRKGRYYVSVIDGDRHGFLLGPFENHVDALAHVDPVRQAAEEWSHDPGCAFYGFGTASLRANWDAPIPRGLMNDYLGYVPPERLLI